MIFQPHREPSLVEAGDIACRSGQISGVRTSTICSGLVVDRTRFDVRWGDNLYEGVFN